MSLSLTSKLKLASGTVFFEDRAGLKRLFDSLASHIDLMFAIDGAYRNYPSDHGLSEDGSRELVQSFSNAVLVDLPFVTEVEKRSKYLELCGKYDCDVLLIIDSDEWVWKADWDKFYKDLNYKILERDQGIYNVYSVKKHSFGGTSDQWGEFPVIWYKPYDMEYVLRHHQFHRKVKFPCHWQGIFADHSNHAVDTIDGIRLWHDHDLRTAKHLQGRSVYQNWLMNHEGDY